MKMSEQINELAEALAKAQGAIANASKDAQNPHFRSSYANLASVREAIRAPLSENGLAYTQLVRTEQGKVQIETMLIHKSGQYMGETLDIPLSKQDAQGIGSATTYGRRYSLMALIGIAAEEDDDDGNVATANAPQQRRELPKQQSPLREVRVPSPSPAEEMVQALKARPSISSLDKLWQNANFKREYSLLNPEDQAWVKSVDASRRKELEADSDPTSMPEQNDPPAPKQQSKASQLADDHIPF